MERPDVRVVGVGGCPQAGHLGATVAAMPVGDEGAHVSSPGMLGTQGKSLLLPLPPLPEM